MTNIRPRRHAIVGLVSLVLLLLSAPASASGPQERRFLLAVGTNVGLPAEGKLRYAESDARRFADLMARIGQVQPRDTVVLKGPNRAALDTALTDFANRARGHGDGAVFLFYFSGHGDADSLHLGPERYPVARLKARLDAIPTTLRFAVIDACRGTSDVKQKGFKRVESFAVKLESPTGLAGVVTLKSSSDGEMSQESSRLRGAVFTHYLLTALRGAADTDRDKRVTLHEAYTYAYRQTVSRSASGPGNIMHPSVKYDLEGAGAFVLTHTEPDTVRIHLPRGRDDQYLVYARPSGTIHAEVWSDPKQSIPVALPAGHYLIHRRAGTRSGAAELQMREGEARTLYPTDFQPLSPQILAQKGGQLRLFHHALHLGGAIAAMHTGQLSYAGRVGYGFGTVTWATSMELSVGSTQYETDHDRRFENWIGLEVRVQRRRLLGPLDLHLGGIVRAVQQRLERLDAPLVNRAGFDADVTFNGYIGGPTAGLGWRHDIARDLSLGITINGAALVALEGDTYRLRPEARGELTARYSF